MSLSGRGPVGSCTPPCRAAASRRTTCSGIRRAPGGCGTSWWRCGGWPWRNADGLSRPSACPPDRPTAYFCLMKLVLFDIDGTLLWTDGAGRRAIQRALLDEAGTAGPIETYRFDGKTDPQIVRDLLSLAGHADADHGSLVQAVCRRYVDHLRTGA